MQQNDRKIIFKALVGSNLHGTNTPDSDKDYLGVYIPSTSEMLALQNRPKEWTENVKVTAAGEKNSKDDVDCKYLALYEWMKQAADGQSQALELLFIPPQNVITKTPEWDEVLAQKDIFISKKGIKPFIGFALAQANKAVLKGQNLVIIQNMIAKLEIEITAGRGKDHIRDRLVTRMVDLEHKLFMGERVPYYQNEHDAKLIKIAYREYDIGLPLKKLLKSLKAMEAKYGTRTRNSAGDGYDFKSASHAFRLVYEAQEFLRTGNLTFPLLQKDFLLKVKQGKYDGDLSQDINQHLDTIRQNIEPNSLLPEKPNYGKIDKLCIAMMKEHILCQ